MSIHVNWLRDWGRRLFGPPPLHPCDVCFEMMTANGYGMCPTCLEAFNSNSVDHKAEFHARFAARLPR